MYINYDVELVVVKFELFTVNSNSIYQVPIIPLLMFL